MRKIEMIVERTNTGFCAYPAKMPVYTTGSGFAELKSNMLEALNLYFEDAGKNYYRK